MRAVSAIVTTLIVFGIALLLSDVIVGAVLDRFVGDVAAANLWIRCMGNAAIAACAACGWVWLLAGGGANRGR